ncbi:fimbrial protein [Klebsiella michiganensis]|uniref:fimbrial protein n=1 Tax=Klebsiella michiganensis TaxID=1134687 RepID=UPI003DA973E2
MHYQNQTTSKIKYLIYNFFCILSLVIGTSTTVFAFTCYDATGVTLDSLYGDQSTNVYVNLQPSLGVGQNLVVDLSQSVFCKNDDPEKRNDFTSILQGSSYSGLLANFTGSLKYYGSSYNFPLMSSTASYNLRSGNFVPWNAILYLTPVTAASGVVVKSGSLIARLVMLHVGTNISDGGREYEARFTWNIYANNDVIVPTGGCDVSSRSVTVNLPNYPASTAIPLTVHCAKNQTLGYYLSGTTADAANSIFTNTASLSAAQGIGIQLTRNNSVIAANKEISLGTVGTSPVNLGLTATYARTSGQVTAGNVQSIIGVTFVYE